uniref:DNA ligase n=1 Tax=Opuntia streptacantha TaxID=393608 RepID=A0A7C9EH37_OPUST
MRRSSQTMIHKPPPLTVAKVLETFRRIAKESGKNSKEKKKNHVRALLVAACDCEPKYLIRLLLKDKLRIGLSELSLLEALACAAAYAEKHSVSCGSFQSDLSKAVDVLKGVHSMVPVYERIVPALLDGGVWNLADTCSFSLGIPCEPMLSAPAKSVSEIVNRYHGIEYTCEYKYDGIRAQIHCMDDGSIRIFSRKLECCTNQYPDVILAVKRLKRVPVKSCVLDCEIVGYDSEQMKILPLQKLMTRGRKGVHVDNIKINACIFAFDLLYLNGQSLLQEQLKIRRKLLEDSFEVKTGILQFATALDSSNLDEIQVFLDKAVNARLMEDYPRVLIQSSKTC